MHFTGRCIQSTETMFDFEAGLREYLYVPTQNENKTTYVDIELKRKIKLEQPCEYFEKFYKKKKRKF